MSESFLSGKVELHAGDMLAVLPMLAENSIDSCVCDPPYHLTSGNVSTDWSSFKTPKGTTNKTGRGHKTGFMGKVWDGGDIAFRPETWAEVYRVLKPGAHLLAFGGTRTYHRMACAIEDAGFEIRDTIMWLYGSGFPKSLDISKAIDKAAGAEREVVGDYAVTREFKGRDYIGEESHATRVNITAPATPEAAQWSGFGTALKPSCEPIVLARKPLSERTVAANVLKWGTGALNIDGARIPTSEKWQGRELPDAEDGVTWGGSLNTSSSSSHELGRWPANVVTDGSDEVVGMFPDVGGGSFAQSGHRIGGKSENCVGLNGIKNAPDNYGDSGSAARFFYTAKADSLDRVGSRHPTVKPLDLIQYLVRLVTPPNGVVLDCFAGTGTTGEAAFREGFRAVLIEREPEYLEDIRRRMALVLAGPDERSRESIKAKLKDKPQDHGPLFGGSETAPGGGRQIYGVFADEKSARSD